MTGGKHPARMRPGRTGPAVPDGPRGPELARAVLDAAKVRRDAAGIGPIEHTYRWHAARLG